MALKVGLDVGSTTIKSVVLNEKNEILSRSYERHFSQVSEKTAMLLESIEAAFAPEKYFNISISGSAGMGIAESIGVPFTQEVYATRVAVSKLLPGTDVVIELGGEDAKILFLTGITEVRMNGSCAGGTGAFIDQMASLLNVTVAEMNDMAKVHTKTHDIASRCGVFAKSDVQALLNQGVSKGEVASSIFYAVVNQTISGLAQARDICGNIVYLGGPLTFLPELRAAFDHTLHTRGVCPEDSLFYVALGTALHTEAPARDIQQVTALIKETSNAGVYKYCRPLFKSQDEYQSFVQRHNQNQPLLNGRLTGKKYAYLGLDAGSTTLKAVVINENEEIIYSKYMPNHGNPVLLVKEFMLELYEQFPDIRILSSASTGYGEEIIKNAFKLDHGIVETVAHFTAAKKFNPQVDFIIDIGGQDIKCFKIREGVLDDIFLNEACSSGCGSFLQSFAGSLGYSMEDFAELGLKADFPVDLGSRCTVFMNSSVKQAQKDGATIENISAGLSISVVKNALNKVIRSLEDIGEHVVVQGGTFLNDAVLRSFEQETGKQVIRPAIAGLMGAYGTALYAKAHAQTHSGIVSRGELENFTHEVKSIVCKGCTNNCRLTVNTFTGTRRYIGGNRCEKPLGGKSSSTQYNIYDYKKQLLKAYPDAGADEKKTIVGIPMGLNMYELYPFWHTFFSRLGFGVVASPESTRQLYLSGQNTIPSDTVCYPAKLMHGHIKSLQGMKVDVIFYPCMSYNIDEGLGDNHYNCPVVAYYPEVISGNMTALKQHNFIYDYVGLHNKKDFPRKIKKILKRNGYHFSFLDIIKATDSAYREYEQYMRKIRDRGREFLEIARQEKMPLIVLAGRPYHLDGEINHGIDKLICDCGAVLVSEDTVSDLAENKRVAVLNQWTYHARLYAAARYVAQREDNWGNLIQFVSFGCGLDAITTDEVRSILAAKGKIYTQLKIDELTNLSAVKIRLRSLFAALEQERVM